jgi:hypothetical protein
MNENTKTVNIGRLAFREEGPNWNAYFSKQDTMLGAVLLGSIKMTLVANNPERREGFMSLMREAFGDITEKTTGSRPSWGGERPAPESERTKE